MKETEKNVEEELKLNIKEYFKHLFDIKRGTSKAGTIKDIKEGISIKGLTAWLLILSILIASIGLNISSTAVVIGAMLIAPLMGPILGVGLSLATNDYETLKRSALNFVAMVVISLVTSFLFFSIPLFQTETPELLARTKPDLRDVLIAIVGGLALIVSLSRRKEMTNTLAGVSIATALMPPICTAGYGLAVGNLNYFLGAFFLFIINANFIALSTILILKFLKFKSAKKIVSQKHKNIVRVASFLTLVIFILSTLTFYNLFKKKKFNKASHTFVELLKEKGINVIDVDDEDFNYENNTILLTVFGRVINDKELKSFDELLEKVKLKDTKILLQQGKDNSNFIKELTDLKNSYTNQLSFLNQKEKTILEKNNVIQKLNAELNMLNSKNIPFKQISEEAKINYSGLKSISYSNQIINNFETIDTLTIFSTHWYDTVPNTQEQYNKMNLWLKKRLNMDSIHIEKY